MDKTKKIIIACSIALVVAVAVLVAVLFKSGESKVEDSSGNVVYTLQPTTTQPTAYNTESWIDINQIAGNITSTTDVSATDLSTTGIGFPVGGTTIIYVDVNGNPIDINQIQNKPTTTQIENHEGLDTPVTDSSNELGLFEINAQGIITKYYGESDAVIIPVKEQGKKVVGIGKGCFKGTSVRSVYIPDTVTSIGDYAFENCSSLTDVGFGSNLTKITIGQGAFKNCTALREITLPAATSVGRLAFDACTSLKKVVFSRGAESIGDYCFSNCRNLERVYIPESVQTFGTSIFDQCNQEKLKIYTPLGSEAEAQAHKEGYKTVQADV